MMEEDVGEEVVKASGVRRTWTMRSNAARQVAVNFVPSRQLPYNTLRLRRTHSEHSALLEENGDRDAEGDSSEQQANIIVREMEQHEPLMEDNLQAEELRRAALRDLPQGLTMKRTVRAKLSASVSLRSKRRPISMFRRLQYRISLGFKRMHDRFHNTVFSIEIWYEAIRTVEGHFGSAVGSYFHFLRKLFLLNLTLTVCVLCLVVVPQVLYDNTHKTYTTREKSFTFFDLVTGKGAMEDTVMFFGHYTSDSSSPPSQYNITFAYFYTMLILYIVVFFVLCYKTARSYRDNFISAGTTLGHVFASKVLCGWDFGIATRHAAELNTRSLYNEFKELLSDQMKNNEPVSRSVIVGQYLANILVSVVVFGFILGLEVVFWLVLSARVEAMDSLRASEHWAVGLALCVTIVISICPLIFSVVGKLEYYKPRTGLYVTLCRTFLLDVSTLFLLLLFWSHSKVDCWQTSLGQQTYRLVLLDALFSLVVLPVIECIRGFIYRRYPVTEPPEFNIAYNSLTLLYNQAVLWLGMVFAPLLVVGVTVKFLLLFYVKRECALRGCQPARKVWRAAQTQTVLYMLVTLSLFMTLFTLGYLFFGSSSHTCGPFKDYSYVYSVLSEGLLRLSAHPTARSMLLYVTRPGVITFVLLFLCVSVYYMRAKSLAQQSMVALLRQMLLLDAKDKDFLLGAIAKVSNGEWLYRPKEGTSQADDSHTWKYLNNGKARRPTNAGFNFDVSKLNFSMAESSRPKSFVSSKDRRPSSAYKERPKSCNNPVESREDGDTDSSFSWQGSGCLNQSSDTHIEVDSEAL